MRMDRHLGLAKQLLAIIILFQLLLFPAWGINLDEPGQHYLIDKWEKTDGIPSNMVKAIAQTPDGYLWIATLNGLVRFDGIKFSNVPLPGKEKDDTLNLIDANALHLDNNETLWIGHTKGLLSYDCKTGKFSTYTEANGLTKDAIRIIKSDKKGNLWISFISSYVNCFSNGKFKAFDKTHGLGGKKINAIVVDREGYLLFSTRENGIFKFNDSIFSKHNINDPDGFINTMYKDHNEILWIGTTQGLLKVTGKDTVKYPTANRSPHNKITRIFESTDHNLWIGTTSGLDQLKRNQKGTVNFESIIKPSPIMCLFEDREKSLWVGTYDSGLRRLKKRKFISYNPLKASPKEIIFSLFEDHDKNTWIGTASGKLLRCRDKNHIETISPPELSGTAIVAIATDSDQNLWLGTNGKGVFQRKGGYFNRFSTLDGLSDNMVTSIYLDKQDNLWFATTDGVSVHRYESGAIESLTKKGGLAGKRVHNVYQVGTGDIWIAADEGITVLKDGKMDKRTIYQEDDNVTCIYEDPFISGNEGSVFWITTHGKGLQRFILKEGKTSIDTYTVNDGMETDNLFQLFEDQQGYFWIMSDKGILRIKKDELIRFASAGNKGDKINCIYYGESDGLRSSEFNNRQSKHSALQNRQGELWFLTTRGISMTKPAEIFTNKTPPTVNIEEILFDEKPVQPNKGESVNVPKGVTRIAFHFSARTLLSPEKVKFKYQLAGSDKEMVYLAARKKRTALYENLKPGTYNFRVIACNADGVWNRTGDSVTFTIPTAFPWSLVLQTLFFLFAVIALSYVVYILRNKSITKTKVEVVEQEVEKIKKEPEVKYKSSNLNAPFVKECIRKLKHLMEVEKVYRDDELKLPTLAKKLSIRHDQLSQILNETLNRNFADYINHYRIEEIKTLLKDPKNKKRKIADMGFQVGFSSQSSFHKKFKEYTGISPGQYRKEALERR